MNQNQSIEEILKENSQKITHLEHNQKVIINSLEQIKKHI